MTQVHTKAGSEEANKHPHGCCQRHLLRFLVPDQLDDIEDDDCDNDDDGNDGNDGNDDDDDNGDNDY